MDATRPQDNGPMDIHQRQALAEKLEKEQNEKGEKGKLDRGKNESTQEDEGESV